MATLRHDGLAAEITPSAGGYDDVGDPETVFHVRLLWHGEPILNPPVLRRRGREHPERPGAVEFWDDRAVELFTVLQGALRSSAAGEYFSQDYDLSISVAPRWGGDLPAPAATAPPAPWFAVAVNFGASALVGADGGIAGEIRLEFDVPRTELERFARDLRAEHDAAWAAYGPPPHQ